MSRDIVADGLNQIMNAKRVGKRELVISHASKVLLSVLEMMKKNGAIEYVVSEDKLSISVSILKVNMCRAVKPRYYVKASDVEKYLRRFLPSRNFGILAISTSKGLMDQHEAKTNKIGGSIVAYFY